MNNKINKIYQNTQSKYYRSGKSKNFLLMYHIHIASNNRIVRNESSQGLWFLQVKNLLVFISTNFLQTITWSIQCDKKYLFTMITQSLYHLAFGERCQIFGRVTMKPTVVVRHSKPKIYSQTNKHWYKKTKND